MPFFSGSFLAKPGLELKRERDSQRLVPGNPLQNNLVLFFYFKIHIFKLFIYLWLCCVFVATRGLSLVVESGGFSPVVGHGLLITVGFLVVGHRLWGVWVQQLHGLSCPAALDCSSQAKDQTPVPCIGRWIPNHWATKEVLNSLILMGGVSGLSLMLCPGSRGRPGGATPVGSLAVLPPPRET